MSYSRRLRRVRLASVIVAASLLLATSSVALADEGGESRNTRANYTPGEKFTPLATSSPCIGEPSGMGAKPFVLPPGYDQQVVAEEGQGGSADLWDMNTQNETGKHAGRYLYRTHETGAASQVTVTDLKTGVTQILAQRPDWERFDGIVWTPWGTILAAEETIVASAKDPTVPQALGGLVYELFVSKSNPMVLDGSRERVTTGDGTTDTKRDGIRARPAVGSKSHEGLRFDERGFLYGIAETRGQTTANQSGGIFRFIPDKKGDLSNGQLFAFQGPGRAPYGQGTWIPLDRTAVQVDADREAEQKGASEYQRPEDVETGESTGVDVNNDGDTLYVAITEGAEMGVLAMDLDGGGDPFAYPYVGPAAGNTTADFTAPDNLALDRKGNLAITEDPPGNPIGADIWIAEPPRGHEGDDDEDRDGARGEPASEVARFASLKDCVAEPTGIYFAMRGTERFTAGTPRAAFVRGDTLFVNRQHAGQTSPVDQLVAIAPVDAGQGDDEDDDED